MECLYCNQESYVFAGSISGTALAALCDDHRARHERMERIFRRVLPEAFTEPVRFRYFEHKGWWYCWTTQRVNGKFVAMIYQPVDDDLVLVKQVPYAKRMTAKAKALAWQQRAQQSTSGRLPASMLK